MSNLITVPTFNFSQGDIFEDAEMPIQVSYYRNPESTLIELVQEDSSICITNLSVLKKLVKEIEKHHSAAKKHLEKI